MAEIDPVILELRADLLRYQSELRKQAADTERQLGRMDRGVQRLEKQMLKSSTAIQGSLRTIGTTLSTYFSGRELVGLIDGFTRLQNSLRVAGLEGQKLEVVQSNLLALSAKYGVGIEGLANLYAKASDAGRSFGASEEEVLKLTEATSQSLLITGTSATQAQGAILGLSQALASGTVRAEEFNQINEGGLRPLLQAAAAAERFGGDINKLRAAVVDGKLSSQEFFNAIMTGAGQLESQASKATLTLSGAFEALSSQLTVYVGSAASANGVTGALADGLKLLADNLDIIIPALATIAAVMGTSVVINAIAGSRAFFALTAAIGGAATAAEAATFAFGGLGAVLTGPVGIAAAVVAVGAGLYYLSTQADGTAEAVERLEQSNRDASDELDRMIGRLKAAGVQTDELAAAAARAKGPIDDLADAYRGALIEARKFSAGTSGGKIQQQSDIITNSQASQASLRQSIANAQRAKAFAGGGDASAAANLDARITGLRSQLAAEIQKERIARATIGAFTAANQAGVDVSDDGGSHSSTGSAAKTKPARTTRAPRDTSDQDAARAAAELSSLQMEELRARAELSTNVEERADFERQILAAERTQREADIDAKVKAKALTADQAAEQRKILDALYGQRITEDGTGDIIVEKQKSIYGQIQERQEQERIARQQTDAMRDELAALGAEAGLQDVRKARVEIERRMLELQQEIERKLLKESIARGEVADAASARAALARKQAADRTGFEKDNKGPLGQYLEEIRKVGLNVDDEFEKVAVNGLQTLNDGLADAIVNSKSLGDVFKNVAKQIIADLIRIAIQQTIVNSLANALSGAFGGGFGGGIINNASGGIKSGSKNFGRASGGYVAPGQTVRVNEHRGGAEYLRMGSQGGTVIPLGQVNERAAMSSSQSGGTVRIVVEEGPNFMSTIRTEATGVSLEVVRSAQPALTELATQETLRRVNRPRMPGAGR